MTSTDRLFTVAIGVRMDAKMVHEYIKAFGLDPRPSDTQRTLRLRDKSWSIVVETYDWGRVCVATNRQMATVTWVEHGGIPEELPNWAMLARHRFDNPGCVGHYDAGDATCDGDGAKEPPCVWRGLCRKVVERAEGERTTPEQAVIYMADDDANEVPPPATRYRCPVERPRAPAPDKQEQQGGGQDDEPEEPPQPRGRSGSPGDPYTWSESRRIALALMSAIAGAIPLEYAGEHEHKCHSGGMFHRDRLDTSRHYTLYIRRNNASGTPLAVAYIYPHKRRPGVKLHLITPPEATAWLRAELPQLLKVKQWKDSGLTPSIIDGIQDKHVPQVARILGRMVREGRWTRVTEQLEG